MSMLSSIVDGAGVFSGAKANNVITITDQGLLAPYPNLPSGRNYQEFENGGAGPTGNGLGGWVNIISGAGAARAALTGEPGWFNGAGSFSTGTTSTGSFMTSRVPAGIQFSSTSGTWVYEAVFSIPVLSDGTNRFALQMGFFDPSLTGGAAPFHGATLAYSDNVNGGKFRLMTSNNGTSTTVDTGVTAVAGTYYHLRIEIVNNTSVTMYLKAVFSGGAWSDDGQWTSPVASSSTNIPTGATPKGFAGMLLIKSLGTTARLLKLGYQLMHRDVAFAPSERSGFRSGGLLSGGDGPGMALGRKGSVLGVGNTNVPGWIAPMRLRHPIVFHAFVRGGWVSSPAADWGYDVGGTGGTGGIGQQVKDDGLWQHTSQLNTGFVADSYASCHTATNLVLDAAVQPMVLESAYRMSPLSTVTNQYVTVFGLTDNLLTASISNGVWIEIDSSVNGAAICKCASGGVVTSVNSGVTIVNDTVYVARIVATSTSVSFWIKADDASAFGSPVATITTNIPTAATMAAALIARNLLGVGTRNVNMSYALAYQRSTT